MANPSIKKEVEPVVDHLPPLDFAGSNYYRAPKSAGDLAKASWAYNDALSVAVMNIVFLGILTPIGVGFAYRAQKLGHPRAWIAFAVNLGPLPLYISFAAKVFHLFAHAKH
jgi:hypothetical protein